MLEQRATAEEGCPISIRNMFDMASQNYEWESFKYQVPRHYLSYCQKKSEPAAKPPHKLNYIDDVLSIKKFVPAPNKYEIKENQRPLSGKMDKNPKKTMTEAIIYQSKRDPSPGPASYFNRPKTAGAKLNKHGPEHREHYLNEVEYLSSEGPGVGEYNLTYFKRDHVVSPKYHKGITISRSAANLKKKGKDKSDKEELSQTIVAGTFDWMATQPKSANKNLFGKSKRFNGGSKF